ncbi:MAG TPA: TRAP transporter small permease subunit [Methylomirabilota bacterium]|nr:TRAP transporter small permease subunit [Methylomirabilota bacterium]
MGFLEALSRVVDAINERVGRSIRVLTLLMVVITTYDVVMRYVFRTSFVFIQELEWHLFAFLFLVAAGYAHLKGDHVRVDIFYARMAPRARAAVDVGGALLFLFPTCFLVVVTAIPFVRASLRVLEGSPDPGGIPARYILKMAIPAGFGLLALQGISQLVKSVRTLQGKGVAP